MSSQNDKMAVPVAEIPISTNTLAMLAKTPAVPERYEGRVSDMLAAVLYGRELGVGPMLSINELYLVDGKVSMSGKLMSHLVHMRGHQLRLSFTNSVSSCEAWRRDPYTHKLELVGTFTFSDNDAKKAGLTGQGAWATYPTMMRTWRAITFACRTEFADCLGGIGFIPEELSIPYGDGGVVEAIPDSIAYVEDVDNPEVLDEILEMEEATNNVAAVMEVVSVTDVAKPAP